MTVRNMDHLGIVVEDIEQAIAFFLALGLELEGEGSVEGDWVDRVVALQGVRARIAMLDLPNGGERVIELAEFESPDGPRAEPSTPANVPGLRHVAFQVSDIEATLESVSQHGGRLVGAVERYGDHLRLCYVRGPAGIIVELAERSG